jgi:hypothetical protein
MPPERLKRPGSVCGYSLSCGSRLTTALVVVLVLVCRGLACGAHHPDDLCRQAGFLPGNEVSAARGGGESAAQVGLHLAAEEVEHGCPALGSSSCGLLADQRD